MSIPKTGRTNLTGSKRLPVPLDDPRVSKKARYKKPIQAITIEKPSLFDLFNAAEGSDLQGRVEFLEKKVTEQLIQLEEREKRISEQTNMLLEQAKLIDDLKRDLMTLKNRGAPIWKTTPLQQPLAGQKNGPVLLMGHNNLAAIEPLNAAVEMNPTNEKEWFDKSEVYFSKNNFTDTLKCLDKAIEINPNNPRTWVNKGEVHFSQNNFTDALKCLDKALEINPNNEMTWFYKGEVHFSLNNASLALACYKEALRLNPANVAAIEGIKRIQED
jgi:tetratricopeptide (TPR) repeat protein